MLHMIDQRQDPQRVPQQVLHAEEVVFEDPLAAQEVQLPVLLQRETAGGMGEEGVILQRREDVFLETQGARNG